MQRIRGVGNKNHLLRAFSLLLGKSDMIIMLSIFPQNGSIGESETYARLRFVIPIKSQVFLSIVSEWLNTCSHAQIGAACPWRNDGELSRVSWLIWVASRKTRA